MPKRIYLDQNVIVALVKNERPRLADHIKKHIEAGTQFVYSPAHIEEIAAILRDFADPADPDRAQRLASINLWMINQVCDGWELLPGEGNVGPTRVLQEDPRVCMERVLDGYELTLSAEENERWLMSYKSPEAFEALQKEWGIDLRGVPLFADKQKELGVEAKRVSGLDPNKLFNDANVLEGLRQKLWHYAWNVDTVPKCQALLDSHNTRQNVVNAVMKYLDEIGYRADRFEKYRSGMHDITHAIYAAAADIFVTGDKRYRDRVVATYQFLGISTEVIGIDEFMAMPLRQATCTGARRAGRGRSGRTCWSATT
jgi:predicted nucleic acid-binding protein